MTRESALDDFLEKEGWDTSERVLLASDASARVYERLIKNGHSVILMNSPLAERPDLFVLIDRLLKRAGIHAPDILAADLKNGFLLLEDFGNDTFSRLLANGADEYNLYLHGVDTLIRLQDKITLPIKNITEYSLKMLMNGVLMLPNWFGKHVVPNGLPDQAIAEFIRIWADLNKRLIDLPKTLVLLDYHVDNLMMTPDGECGVLDFQDARIGPVTYDLMSLLEDERRDVSPDVRERLIEHYFLARPQIDLPEVRQTLPIVAMQRHTRVIGIFVRLFLRDRKERYLKMIPLIWTMVERHLNNPVFAGYKAWLDKYIPTAIRHNLLKPEDLK